MLLNEVIVYIRKKYKNIVTLLLNIVIIILIMYYSWLHFENKCNMSVNLSDLLAITTYVFKANDIDFWINWGILTY